ncbi:MAG: ABC transporter permease subunit [Anaerolineales bacterium]|nr:ABC transporter permease subunit [Anaerolineales bacterium]
MSMQKRWWRRAHLEESLFGVLMRLSAVVLVLALAGILGSVLVRGLPAMSWDMITKAPEGGFYLGGGGGLLNAILGSLYLAGGGTVLAFLVSLPIALGLNVYAPSSRWATFTRLTLDVLWGVPSLVYGAFGFLIMISMGMRASLGAGILVVSLLQIPIMVRGMDEVMRLIPSGQKEAAFGLGATKLEMARAVVLRQSLPGIFTAVLLAFGRGIGDAASVLFTAGFTDRIPTSLAGPAASLPLAVFFQLSSPFPEVRARGYAAALILTVLILIVSGLSRALARRLSRNVVN